MEEATQMNWTLEEHFHAMEEDSCLVRTENSAENCPPGHDCAECEHYEQDAQEQPCKYAQDTGDKNYPTLCEKDNRYAKASYCQTCKHRRPK